MMENQNANTTRTSNEGNSRPSNTTNQIPKPSCISGERAVSFSSIEIREFPLCMGDNPGCLRGIPITIDWTHTRERSWSLEDYEHHRGEPCEAIAIPPHKRFEMLTETKMYTRCEIMKMLQKVESDRERRRCSCEDSEKFEEYIEGLKRGFLNKTFRRKEKQKERELLLPYLPLESQKKGRLGRSLSLTSTSCESSFEDDPIGHIESEIEEPLKVEA